ncbi:hypothetical protein [Desulfosarcina sp.]|uniref:hypothetical protein n=1 Tax=Desulfosarcina sp. TaxID=2027861 RepID=UPI0029A079DA|nr:hypothetical protein [Desulfosarcina sp.]MDX2452462.1 hypothetical protein [Desulfosarcina sp.]MDX2490239.1 hypothetical protein [Desulfosarcina sp.]
MAYYPIIQKNERQVATSGHRLLPIFYMEDFSVLGFRVNDCGHAIRVLDRHAFVLKRANGSIEVNIDRASQIREVMQLLNGSGLECEIADIAEGMYQG